MEEKFSLKDFLFNKEKVEKIAGEIKAVYKDFKQEEFTKTILGKFPELELKERISWISENLKAFLPQGYRTAATILLAALPPPSDDTKTDDDFGDFIYAPYCDFIAKYGRHKRDVSFSLEAIKEMTMRFSAEDAIRYFINEFPEETFAELEKWSKDSHYHVRRLVSEGTRPKLPWAQKITIPVEKPLPLLDNLYYDKTRFVTRSVANHMNDISKVNSELVLKTLDRWQKSEKQDAKEMEFIIKHSLRTLVKRGNKHAIEYLNFSSDPAVRVSNVIIKRDPVKLGDYLEFEFTITAEKDERLLIDYIIYFQSKNGTMTNSKVFKIKQLEMQSGESLTIVKRHKLLKMTTRTLYSGKHIVEVQINGMKMKRKEFDLII